MVSRNGQDFHITILSPFSGSKPDRIDVEGFEFSTGEFEESLQSFMARKDIDKVTYVTEIWRQAETKFKRRHVIFMRVSEKHTLDQSKIDIELHALPIAVRSEINDGIVIDKVTAAAAFLGLMMTSKVPYIHAGKWLMSIRRNRKKMPLVLVAIAILICFRMDGLAFLTGAYILSGPVLMIFEARFGKKNVEGEN